MSHKLFLWYNPHACRKIFNPTVELATSQAVRSSQFCIHTLSLWLFLMAHD